ncbi:MAG: hypothetical protein KTR31_07965 [Myxococcales bacterium]|nr:hypothetical protein [Myxococcales bacterium]
MHELDLGEGVTLRSTAGVDVGGTTRGPRSTNDAAAWFTLHAALAGAGLEAVRDVTLAPRAAPGDGTRSGADPGVELDVVVEEGADAIVLLDRGGRLTWHLGEVVPTPAEPSRTRRFTLQSEAEEPSRFALDALRTIVFRYVAERVATATATAWVAGWEADVPQGPIVVEGADVERWRRVPDLSSLQIQPGARVLLLLHGTFSSTVGSFGQLCAPPGRSVLEGWLETYDHVIGFDHRTLSVGPADNARALVEALQQAEWPQGVVLDLVCFSRGGLVGRWLTEHVLPTHAPHLTVRRALLVGATTSGTLLARPENWKAFLDLATNLSMGTCRLLTVAAPQSAVALEVLRASIEGLSVLAKALANQVLEAGAVPGLQAMDPHGEGVRSLNAGPSPAGRPEAGYAVVSVDFEPTLFRNDPSATGLSRHVLLWLADTFVDGLFGGEPNDLVVDNAASRRMHPDLGQPQQLELPRGAAVHHLSFFSSAWCLQALRWLLHPSEQPALPTPTQRLTPPLADDAIAALLAEARASSHTHHLRILRRRSPELQGFWLGPELSAEPLTDAPLLTLTQHDEAVATDLVTPATLWCEGHDHRTLWVFRWSLPQLASIEDAHLGVRVHPDRVHPTSLGLLRCAMPESPPDATRRSPSLLVPDDWVTRSTILELELGRPGEETRSLERHRAGGLTWDELGIPPLSEVVPADVYEALDLDAVEQEILELEDQVRTLERAHRGETTRAATSRLGKLRNKLHSMAQGVHSALGALQRVRDDLGVEFYEIVGLSGPQRVGRLAVFAHMVALEVGDLVDDARLSATWYDPLPWVWQGGPVPRRANLGALGTYALFPRGMNRSVYGTYLMYLFAYDEMARSAGPPAFGELDEVAARRAYRESRFPDAPARSTHPDPHSDVWVCDRLLNGVATPSFRADSRYPGARVLVLRWSDRRAPENRLGQRLYLPDLTVVCGEHQGGLSLQRIVLSYADGPTLDVAPTDEVLWARAKVVLRGQLVLYGELTPHLARGHLMCERMQGVVHHARQRLPNEARALSLLTPFLDGADAINRVGDLLILEDDGAIPAGTPFDGAAIAARLARDLGAVDWWGFAPRARQLEQDRYAHAANVFWTMVTEWVADELPDTAIEPAHWQAINAALDDCVVQYHPHDGDPEARWLDDNEHAKAMVRGQPHGSDAFTRLTSADDLRQLVAFVVFHATFQHSWVNDAQWDEGGDPFFAPMATRLRIDERPTASLRAWTNAAGPAFVDACYQRLIAFALTHFDSGYVWFDDLEPRVPASFKERVEALPAPFVHPEADGPPDVRLRKDHIRSRMNS